MASVLDTPLPEAEAHFQQFGGRMQEEFHLPPAADEPLHADARLLTVDRPDAKRTEQTVTHLQMLGYLPDTPSLAAAAIDRALANWEQDFRSARERGGFAYSPDFLAENPDRFPWPEARLRYLKALATFEGEVVLARLPAGDTPTLESRVAHLRLVTYGLARAVDVNTTQSRDTFAAADPFGPAALASASVGAGLLLDDRAAHLELLNLLGNAPAATDRFLERFASRRFLFQGEVVRGAPDVATWGVDQQPTWMPRWQKDNAFWLPAGPAPSRVARPRLTELRFPARLDLARVQLEAQLPLNVFALELLQLRLWMLGYYLGELDAAWGPLTESALLALGRDHADLLGPPDAYLGVGRDGWRAVNLHRVLGVIVDRFDLAAEALSAAEMTGITEGVADALTAAEWEEVDARYQEHRARQRAVLAAPQVSASGFSLPSARPERMRYFGWRRFFSAVGAFVRDAANRVAGAIRRIVGALKAGLAQAFEVLRFLWRKVRIAVRIARLAARRLVCWLTGSPVGTVIDSHCVVTHWGLDFDSVVCASRECPAPVYVRHQERLDWMSRSLVFMGDLALFVLAALTRAAVGSWLALAYEVFRYVRKLVLDPAARAVFSDDILERGTI